MLQDPEIRAGIKEFSRLADGPAALRQGRVRRRIGHHDGDVRERGIAGHPPCERSEWGGGPFGVAEWWRGRPLRQPCGQLKFLPASTAGGEGNHAEHGGGVANADALYPSTIPSSGNGSPPHACGTGRNGRNEKGAARGTREPSEPPLLVLAWNQVDAAIVAMRVPIRGNGQFLPFFLWHDPAPLRQP